MSTTTANPTPRAARPTGATAPAAGTLARLPRLPRVPALRDSVEQIWLAGLGAVAMTGDEGVRLFGSLVRRGADVDRAARHRMDDMLRDARTRADTLQREMRALPAEVTTRATTAIEHTLDDGVRTLLDRVGIPTQRELRALERRVEGLTTALAAPRRREARKARPAKAAPATATLPSRAPRTARTARTVKRPTA